MMMYTADRVAGLIPCGLSQRFDVFHPIQVSRCIHMSSHGLNVQYRHVGDGNLNWCKEQSISISK